MPLPPSPVQKGDCAWQGLGKAIRKTNTKRQVKKEVGGDVFVSSIRTTKLLIHKRVCIFSTIDSFIMLGVYSQPI
jgi:hypothetical protein